MNIYILLMDNLLLINDLPSEILELITSNLDIQSLSYLSRSCKYFNSIINLTSRIKHVVDKGYEYDTVDGLKHGKLIKISEDSRWEKNYKFGMLSGESKMYYNNELELSIQYKCDKYHGDYIEYHGKDIKVKCTYIYGVKEGPYIEYFTDDVESAYDRKIYKEQYYRCDKLHGKSIEYDRYGRYKLTTYNDGIKHGMYKKWDSDYNWKSFNYKDDKLHGTYICWKSYSYKDCETNGHYILPKSRGYVDAKISRISISHGKMGSDYKIDISIVKTKNYKDSQLHGECKTIYVSKGATLEAGIVIKRKFYYKNILHGPYIKYYNKQFKSSEIIYKSGYIVKKTTYHDNGAIDTLNPIYLSGRIHGPSFQYNKDGKVIKIDGYQHGHKVESVSY